MEAHKTFVSDPKDIPEVLEQLRESGIPEKFDKNFLSQIDTEENISNLYVHLFKRIGLIDDDLVPIKENYSEFVESEEKSRAKIAELLRSSYKKIFEHNKKVHRLSEEEIKEVFHEVSEDSKSEKLINLSAQTFKGLTEYAYKHSVNGKPKKEVTMSEENINETDENAEKAQNGQNHQEVHSDNTKYSDETVLVTNDVEKIEEGEVAKVFGLMETENLSNDQQSSEMDNRDQSVSKSKFLKKALWRRAKLLEMMDDYDSAAEAYNAIIKYANKDGVQIEEKKLTEAFYKTASLLEQQAKYEEAVSVYNEFIKKCG